MNQLGVKFLSLPHRWEVISNRLKTPEILWFQGFLHFAIAQINSNRVKDEGLRGAQFGAHDLSIFMCPEFRANPCRATCSENEHLDS